MAFFICWLWMVMTCLMQKDAADHAVLVAMYMADVHTELFSLPLLAQVYSWTARLLAALKTFCDWQQIQVSKQCLMSCEMHWEKIKVTIGQLSIAVSGGLQKMYPQTKTKEDWKLELVMLQSWKVTLCALDERSCGQCHACFAPDQAAAPFCKRVARISGKCCFGRHIVV